MPAFGTSVATDIASAVLDFHVRGKALWQTMQEKPLLGWLNRGKQTFPSGKQYVTEPIQGGAMSDSASFMVGYSEDDQLSFAQAQNILRAQVPWKETHAGLVITHTELKKDGITLTDGETSTSDHGSQLANLTRLLENRIADYKESWARASNEMFWKDGSQDAKQIPGVLSLLLDDPTTGTVASISQQTYTWWRSRASLALVPSPENQTISKFLRDEVIQLTRFGGKPNKAFCGSAFWSALMSEVEKKGQYTQTGFADKETDIAVNKIAIAGIGVFEYDPTLDTMGLERRCYVMDSRRIRYRPMQGEENKTLAPARPYQYMLMLKSMTNTGALEVTQLNCHAVYGVAA